MSQTQGSIQLDKSENIQIKKEHRAAKSFFSGGIAGACAKTVIAPFERIKLLFVTRDRTFSYKEFINEGKFIVQKHGVKNLWRGNSANLLRIFPFASINIYNPYPNEKKVKKQMVLFGVGAASGIVAQSTCYPFEFIRTRLAMQRDNFHYKNLTDAVKTVYQHEGIRGFYSGLGLAIIGVIFYHGSGFFMMTNLKNYTREHHYEYANRWYMDFLFGAIGATVSQIISYPFDVMRKRRQAQSLLISTGEQSHKMTYKELMKYYIKKEGYIPTFYKGITVNLVKGPLSSGTAWMVKNQLNRFLDKTYDL